MHQLIAHNQIHVLSVVLQVVALIIQVPQSTGVIVLPVTSWQLTALIVWILMNASWASILAIDSQRFAIIRAVASGAWLANKQQVSRLKIL